MTTNYLAKTQTQTQTKTKTKTFYVVLHVNEIRFLKKIKSFQRHFKI